MTTRRYLLGGSLSLAAVMRAPDPAGAQASGQFGQSGLVGKLEGATLANTVPARFQEAPQLAELVKAGKLPRPPSACHPNPSSSSPCTPSAAMAAPGAAPSSAPATPRTATAWSPATSRCSGT